MALAVRPTWADVVAGLTVALVLIPQSMAYAEIAGVPARHGLYAAAAAPVLAALASSSPYLQTGPVALTSLLVLGALTPLAESDTEDFARHAVLLALVVGVTRVIIGALRLGFVAYLMSQPVVAAFTFSAAVLIAGSQVPALLGTSGKSDNPLVAAVGAVTSPGDWIPVAIAIGLAAIVVTLGARRVSPLVPGAFVAALTALLLSTAGVLSVPVVGGIPSGLPEVTFALPWEALPSLLVPGVVIALIGFAEAASIARRYASEDRERWSPDREFVGQGLANLGAAAFSGYPVGGSFSRSALNRLSGARTRWSGLITGLTVLAILPVAAVLSDLPRSVMAGLVIASVIPLLALRPIVQAWHLSRPQFGVALVTLVVSIAAAPQVHWGVIAGVLCALALHLLRELRLHLDVWSSVDPAGDRQSDEATLHLRPEGVLYFGSAPALESRVLDELVAHPELAAMHVHLQRLGRIDLTGALVLRTLARDLARAGVSVTLSGAQPHNRRLIEAVFADDPFGYHPDATPYSGGPPGHTRE